MADQDASERHQPVRDAAGFHQFAGQNEKRNGEQRKIVDAAEGAACHDTQWRAFEQPQADERRCAERKGDRHAGNHEGEKKGE